MKTENFFYIVLHNDIDIENASSQILSLSLSLMSIFFSLLYISIDKNILFVWKCEWVMCGIAFLNTYKLFPFVLRLQRKKSSVLRLIFRNDTRHLIL